MNCNEVLLQLSAWLDGELAPDHAEAVDAHVADCSSCAAEAEMLRELDGSLVGTLTEPGADVADRVAEQVLAALPTAPAAETAPRAESTTPDAPPAPPVRGRWEWLSIGLAMAIGFLVAVLLFQPWRTNERTRYVDRPTPVPNPVPNPGTDDAPRDDTPVPDPVDPAIARLVHATGPVLVWTEAAPAWSTIEQPENYACPSNAMIRTEPGTRAEVHTADGAVIRLNDDTELQVKSPREVELGKGQIWCRSPEDVRLEVTAKGLPDSRTSCAAGSCMWTVDEECVRVTTAEGDVALRTEEGEHRLRRGESVVVRGGRVQPPPNEEDPFLATRWIHPLLVRKGANDPELDDRVNAYLAHIGRTKVSYMYEQEVRSLGEAGALPLLRYVQSTLSRDTTSRRIRAARILADVAPTWMVGELIELLADDEPDVRESAATALARLTGESMQMKPTDWGTELPDAEEAVERWRAWWETHRERYPAPEAVLPKPPLPALPGRTLERSPGKLPGKARKVTSIDPPRFARRA